MSKEAEPKKICFVVGPIGDSGTDMRTHADWFYEEIICPVIAEFKEFDDPVRADKIAQPGMIDAQVIRHLFDAELVIADLSYLNANAFYEIGIRHMAEKPIIHMQLVGDKIPFDVSLYRAIKFSLSHPKDLRDARQALSEAVQATIDAKAEIENPVTRARGQIKVRESASPENKVLIDQIEALQQRMSLLEISRQRHTSRVDDMPLHDESGGFNVRIEHRSDPEYPKIIHQLLFDVFGSRVEQAHTSGGLTRALIRANEMSVEELTTAEKQLARARGVHSVMIIPF